MRIRNSTSCDMTLTLSCNNKCLFCPRKDFLKWIVCGSWKEIVREIKDVSRRSRKIVLTGGEVTVYPGLFRVLNICRKVFRDIEIISNGRKMKETAFLDKLIGSGANAFAISIYSLSDAVHDTITGVKGSCRETKKGILNLIKARKTRRITIRINTTLSAGNALHAVDMIKKLYLLGIRDFIIAEEIILNKRRKALDLQGIRKALEDVSRLKFRDIRIVLKGFPPCLVRDLRNPFIRYEPYGLESCIKKGWRQEKYTERFRGNFAKLKKCSGCSLDKHCPGFQKYYPDAGRFIRPVS
ncbi:MAG: radical SAM protein [bacterium]|nr:radical SAM protein [bacterium]